LRLVDRDVVEPSNLPRQVLFDESDARERRPKVEAAARSLARIGGPTRVVPHARHVGAEELGELGSDVDLILDGTDNLPTRYRINDHAVSRGIPWIYAGVVGATGLVLPVFPGRGPCLRCLFPDPAPPGSLETCDSAGVILPAVAAVAAIEAAAALRYLAADAQERGRSAARLTQLDLWRGEFQTIEVERRADCPCCGAGEFPFLAEAELDRAVVLCGRNTVQLPAPPSRPDLAALEARLRRSSAEGVERSGPLLRFRAEGHSLTVFPDGRALVEGTEDPARALALHDRFLGS
jgi:molybdopterin/thiamine biosynthesis adenylyltransferase